ncbi:MAG: hypothetical protein GXY82_00690 [Methanospirillum sp.]|nr:hypothetical protein [Methanospirillum sp.]
MAARVSNRVIAERIDELETFIEDSLTEAVSANASWKDPLTLTLALGDGEDEYSVDQIREAARNCYEAYHANALIRRAVNVKSHFVWGRGVTITSDQVEVNAVLTDWLERNQGELGHLGRVEKEIQVQIGGNLFLLCQVDELGAVEVVTVPISEIAGYLRDPKNPRKVWYWKRTFTEYTVQKDGTSTGKSQTYWYPALGHNPEKQPKTIGGTPVVWTDRLYHAPLPRAGKGVYGLPAIVAGIPWGKAYTQHLSNVASINAALATFAWKATGANPAAARAVADIVDRQKRTPIPAGSTLASTPGVTMEPIRTAGVATSADEARRFALMVCSDTDVPEHILLGDPSTGNLATTKTMERPLELAVLDRQAWWVDTLTLLGSFAVEARVLAQGFAPLTGKVEFDDWGRRQVLVSVRRVVKDHETDREVTEARAAKAAPGTKATKKEAADANLGPVREEVAEVTVEFPAILEHDPVSEVAAIISAATAGTGSLAGIMDRATFQRLLLRALNIPNVDDAIAEMDDEDIARQVERHENPPELELARQAQAAKLGGEEPDEDDEDAPPAKKGVKKPTKRSRDNDVEEGIEESLSAVATALQEVARTALVEAELAEAFDPTAPGKWVTLKDGRRVYIKDKGAGTGPMGPGTAQSTLGAEPAPAPEQLAPGPVDERGRPAAVRKRLDEFTEWHAEDRVESLLVVAPDGSTVFYGTGDVRGVPFDPEDAAKFPGCTAIHNHPSDNSFSDKDLAMTVTHGIAEHVVVSPKYVFSLDTTAYSDHDAHLALARHAVAEGSLYAKYRPKVRSGEMGEKEASNEHTHETMQIVASEYPGIHYTRWIRGKGMGIR